MKIGAHESIAGGLANAFKHAEEHGCEALQIFTTNGSRWAPTPRDPAEVAAFAALARRRGLPLLAHDSYLINLAASGELLAKSRAAFLAELERCEVLGVDHLVFHPGAHCGDGARRGLARVVASMRWALARTRGYRVRLLVELTAGQGTCLGASFEELRAILDGVGAPERTGICFDTCHALAAGYDLATPDGYDAVWDAFDELVGLEHLHAFHLNDSKKGLGSRVDRHAEIGEGFVGEGAFRRLATDRRFARTPAVLELPPSVVPRNLERLRAWARPAHNRRRARS